MEVLEEVGAEPAEGVELGIGVGAETVAKVVAEIVAKGGVETVVEV